MCPLTPRAAPVAVKSTIASRMSWMLCLSVSSCSSVKLGLLGSSLSLEMNIPNGQSRPITAVREGGNAYGLSFLRSMGNALFVPDMVVGMQGEKIAMVAAGCYRSALSSRPLSSQPRRLTKLTSSSQMRTGKTGVCYSTATLGYALPRSATFA